MTTATAPAPAAIPSATKPQSTVAQTAPVPVAPVVDAAKTLEAKQAELAAKEAALSKKERVYQAERLKEARLREQGKKELGAKLSRLAELEKEEKLWSINPDPLLKKRLGDDYYDKLTSLKVNGGALPAEALAHELESVEERITRRIEEKQKAEREETAKAEEEKYSQLRAGAEEEASDYLSKVWSEYPVFGAYNKQGVAKAVVQFIEEQSVKHGKAVSIKDAVNALEEHEVNRALRVAGLDKYKSKLTDNSKPVTVPPVVGSTQAGSTKSGRTLTNDLTASTVGRNPPRTDEERRERVIAAIHAVKAART